MKRMAAARYDAIADSYGADEDDDGAAIAALLELIGPARPESARSGPWPRNRRP
jgi:hypothetical protein